MKKLSKKIKKGVIKQIENDIKESIIEKIYGSDSKKQLKKLKNKLYEEIQEELFGELDEDLTNELQEAVDEITEEVLDDAEIQAPEEKEEKKFVEYQGFKFDVEKMSSLVTGKPVERKDVSKGPKISDLTEDEKKNLNNMHKLIGLKPNDPNNIPMELLRGLGESVKSPSYPSIVGVGTSFTSLNKKILKPSFPEISQEKREEIDFFIGKLKDGIDKLKKSQKSINYRKKKGEIYTFSYHKSKEKNLDFSLNFSLDLNIYTYGATINKFEFEMDGFRFNEKNVEILDMITVLDTVGMSLIKYIEEIGNINSSAEDSKIAIKDNLKKNAKAIRANTKLGTFIFDERIKRLLMSNDIKTYGQLKKIEDLTALKGIGSKTADKIEGYIKK